MKLCRNCNHWQAQEEYLERIDRNTSSQKAQLGLCKRYAPRPLDPGAAAAGNGSALDICWPRTGSDDWCGEYDPQVN